MVDRALRTIFLERRHRAGRVVHEAGAAIYPLAEIVQQALFPNSQHGNLLL
jgi:hypothetical protein